MSATAATPKWTIGVPLATLGLIAVIEFALHGAPPLWLLLCAAPLLFLSVLSAVHHAETVAHRIGQPIGSVVLALAVTVIEVSLIVSVLLSDTDGDSTVARDTVFAAIMIVMNGIVGLCLLIGGIRYHRQDFRAPSALAALGVLSTLAVLALILPNFTLAEPGPVYAPVQLFFVAVVSLFLYGLFLFVQTVSHSDDFLDAVGADLEAEGARPPGAGSSRRF